MADIRYGKSQITFSIKFKLWHEKKSFSVISMIVMKYQNNERAAKIYRKPQLLQRLNNKVSNLGLNKIFYTKWTHSF